MLHSKLFLSCTTLTFFLFLKLFNIYLVLTLGFAPVVACFKESWSSENDLVYHSCFS